MQSEEEIKPKAEETDAVVEEESLLHVSNLTRYEIHFHTNAMNTSLSFTHFQKCKG